MADRVSDLDRTDGSLSASGGLDFAYDGVNFYVYRWENPKTGEPASILFDPSYQKLNIAYQVFGIESADEVSLLRQYDDDSEFGLVHVVIDGTVVAKLELTSDLPPFADLKDHITLVMWDRNTEVTAERPAGTRGPDAFLFDAGENDQAPIDIEGINDDDADNNMETPLDTAGFELSQAAFGGTDEFVI